MLKSCLLNETHRLNNTNITHYVKRDKSLEEKKKEWKLEEWELPPNNNNSEKRKKTTG